MTILFSGLFLYLLLLGIFYLFQDRFIFQPTNLPASYRFTFDDPFEEINLETTDGYQINTIYFSDSIQNTNGVILYLHGNRDNLQRWGRYYKDFFPLGYNFFAIDYRGYGKSSGKPAEKGLIEDALTAYRWLRQQYAADEIIIYGRSLGTGVATQLAAQVPARQLILETPFNSIEGSIHRKYGVLSYPLSVRNNFPSEDYIQQVTYPVYIIHGTKDEIVPYSSARVLQPLLQEDRNFFTIPGGKHKNLNSFPAYYQYIKEILERKI